MARGCGIGDARFVRTEKEIEFLRTAIHAGKGPLFADVKVIDEKLPLVLPPHDGVLLKERFRRALLGPSADVLPEKP
ncbi:hypothetical protein D3C83_128780 [compost metagenome]